MRNYRNFAFVRIISAMAAMLIMVSSVSFGDSQEPVWSSKDLQSAEILTAIGILDEQLREQLFEKEFFTRAEFVFLATRMARTAFYDRGYEPLFADVNTGYWAATEIIAAAKAGMISGFGDGTFLPDGEITVEQALKISLSILGYDAYVQAHGGFPIGVYKVAHQTGLLRDGAAMGNSPLTVSEGLRLVLSALDTQVLLRKHTTLYGDNESEYYTENGRTLLYENYDIVRQVGIVDANELTTLSTPVGVGKDKVRIDGVLFEVGKTNAKDYIGQRVEYYAKIDRTDDKAGVLLALHSHDKRQTIVTVSAENIYDTFGLDEIQYYTDNTQQRRTSLHLDKEVDVIVNGRVFFGATEDTLFPYNGSITAIDNDNDGLYDCVIVRRIDNYVIAGIDTQLETITDLYTMPVLNVNKDEVELSIVSEEGEVLNLSDLRKWDVLAVEASLGYVSITLIERSMYGTVEGYTSSDNTVIIDGKEYRVSASYIRALDKMREITQDPMHIPTAQQQNLLNAVREITPGMYALFVLDENDRIAGINFDVSANLYCYVIKSAMQKDLGGSLEVKVLNYNGMVEILTFAKKITVNGSPGFTPSQVHDILQNSGDEGQLIRYGVNQEGLINEFNTYNTDGTNPHNFTMSLPRALRSEAAGRRVIGNADSFILDSTTLIFNIPQIESDFFEEDLYYVDSKFGKNKVSEVYDMSINGTPQAVVIYYDPTTEEMSSEDIRAAGICVVSAKVTALDEGGNHVTTLYGLINGKNVRLIPQKEEMFEDINAGDIIQYSEKRSKVVFVTKLFSLRQADGYFDNLQQVDSSGISWHELVYCKLYGKTDNILKVSVKENPLVNVFGDFIFYPYNPQRVNVYVYNERGVEKYRLGTADDIIEGAELYMRLKNSELIEVVVLE